MWYRQAEQKQMIIMRGMKGIAYIDL